jgi:protein-arginine kinase activator protein McsA
MMMAKYKVKITVKAECTYETEVEASSESAAEDAASGQWRDKLPFDFQVGKGYITDWDAEETTQLTFECEECETAITEQEYRQHDFMCANCSATLEKVGTN